MTSLQLLREHKLKSNTSCFVLLSGGYSFICPNVLVLFDMFEIFYNLKESMVVVVVLFLKKKKKTK